MGCGDGAFVFHAARATNCYAAGVDHSAKAVEAARDLADTLDFGFRTSFHVADFYELVQRNPADEDDPNAVGVTPAHVAFWNASVVYMYLDGPTTAQLGPMLRRSLRAGTRIISVDYPLASLHHQAHVELDVPELIPVKHTGYTVVYLYVAPGPHVPLPEAAATH